MSPTAGPTKPFLRISRAALLSLGAGIGTFVTLQAAAQPLTITHLAGADRGPGWSDGAGEAARFSYPWGVAPDGNGNLFVADLANHTIRRIVLSTGDVSTLAGLAESPGTIDGRGGAARFSGPAGVAVDRSGNVYVTDRYSCAIRKIVVATGEVTTLAGLPGVTGDTDGVGSAARFGFPEGMAADASGNLFIADTANHTIRRLVVATGEVTTIAGLAGTSGSADGRGAAGRFNRPVGIAADRAGNLFVSDTGNQTIRRIVVATGEVTTLAGQAGTSGGQDGTGSAARFATPSGVAPDGAGNVYVADTRNNAIRKVAVQTGDVTTLALTGSSDVGIFTPSGVALDDAGNLFITDQGAHAIRKLVVATGLLTNLAGPGAFIGGADGTRTAARFAFPSGVSADSSGNLFVADTENHTIRKIVLATGEVSTVAGFAGESGSADGTGSDARFFRPNGIAADGSGDIYVADSDNSTIRKIAPGGAVTTLAGLAGAIGTTDGPGNAARFDAPSGACLDGHGNLFVADRINHTIRRIVLATGEVTTLAGLAGQFGSADGRGNAARFGAPTGIASDGAGNLYVADRRFVFGPYFPLNGCTIRKIVVATGDVTTLAGKAGWCGSVDGTGESAQFLNPSGVAADRSGNVYVADRDNQTIRRIVAATGEVTTVAGMAGEYGRVDGTGSAARFWDPQGIAVGANGTVYVADWGNSCIRMGTVDAGLADAAVIDSALAPVGQTRQLDTSGQTATHWLWEQVRRPSASSATLSSTTIRNPTFTPEVPDLYVFRLTASDDSGAQNITTVSLTATTANPGPGRRRAPVPPEPPLPYDPGRKTD